MLAVGIILVALAQLCLLSYVVTEFRRINDRHRRLQAQIEFIGEIFALNESAHSSLREAILTLANESDKRFIRKTPIVDMVDSAKKRLD